MKKDKTFINFKDDDRGLSLIEVIIAVAILAIIFMPIMKNFILSSTTNMKAQMAQNATSLSEDIMELVKSSSIEDLYNSATKTEDEFKPSIGGVKVDCDSITFLADLETAEDDSGFRDAAGKCKKPAYEITYSNVRATQSLMYDAEVTISRDEYANAGNPDDASDINVVELPRLYDIHDSKDHAVLSWEINKYDIAAGENLAVQYADESEPTKTKAKIRERIEEAGTKTTTITLSGSDDVTIECNVKYEEPDYGKTLEYNVYTGHLKYIEKNNKSNGGPHVYLFYAMMPFVIPPSSSSSSSTDPAPCVFPNEVINIVDNTTKGVHDIYLIMQDTEDISNLKYVHDGKTSNIKIKYNGADVITSTILTQTQWAVGEGETLYTNFTIPVGTESKAGKLYEEKAKDRIYQVTVKVYEHGKSELLATLTSTMEAGSEADD